MDPKEYAALVAKTKPLLDFMDGAENKRVEETPEGKVIHATKNGKPTAYLLGENQRLLY